MSSSKNYKLEISPSINQTSATESQNLLKFTVRNDRPSKIITYRLPIIVLLASLTVANIIQNLEQVKNYDIDASHHGILLILVVGIVLLLCLQTPEDTLIVMRGIGIQLQSKKMWRFQSSDSFIPINNMIDLVIHEGFHDYGQVIFYLCVLTKANNDKNPITIVFPEFLPRKDILLTVWRLSRELLFGSTKRYWRRVPGQGLKQVI